MIRPLLVAFSFAAVTPGQEGPTLVLRGGRLFDPATLSSRPLGQLWLRGRLVAGEKAAGSAIPAGVPVIDATGCTVLPGLFDLHAHVAVHGGGYALSLQPEENLETALLCGVTNVVDLHNDQRTVFALRDRSRVAPQLARLWSAGAAFTVPKGHATQFGIPANEVTSVADVAARFAELLPHAPDVIKLVLERGEWGGLPVMPTLSDELTRAVVAAAHGAKRRAWCHVWGLPDAKAAVGAGVDALAHGVFLGQADAELADAMVKAKTAYIPTLSVVVASTRALRKRSPYAHPLVHEVLHPELAALLNDPEPGGTLAVSPMARFGRELEPVFLRSLKLLADRGVSLGLGTDAGNPFVPHGPGVLFELELYVAAGLTPAQALRAATLGSAEVLGVADRFGALAEGREADLVVVRGDPLADIAAVWQVVDVVKAGQRVAREPVRARNAERAKPPEVVRITDAARQPAFGFGGRFLASTDQRAPGGNSKSELIDEPERVLRFRGEVRAGFQWGPWAGATVLWHPERRRIVDASALTGLRLELRGSKRPLTLTVQCAAVKDFNVFTATLTPTDVLTTFDVPFSSLRQIGFGKEVDWTGTDLTGLGLEYRCPPLGKPKEGPVELEVVSIRFY
jgi:imidazolonepropionase-like amidohydrolase